MQSLYLYVKDGAGIHFHAVMIQYVFRKALLILELDVHEFVLRLLVVSIYGYAVDLLKVCDPVGTHMVGNPVS